jgi:hypothetical protein
MAEAGKEGVVKLVESYPAYFNIKLQAFEEGDQISMVKPIIRDIKIFISSTYMDLREERQNTVDRVIPMINSHAKHKVLIFGNYYNI